MKMLKALLLALGTVALSAHAEVTTTALAPPASGAATQRFTVGVKIAPPFVVKDGDHYSGPAIEAWKKAAAEHGWHYTFKQYDLKGLLDAVAAHQVDAGLGAITATAAREQRMDFSHTLISSGLGIAVASNQTAGWLAILKALVSPTFLGVVGMLLVLLLIVGTLTWLLERRRNTEQFGGSAASGIGSGLWWAAVTMTTVGYGDKAPATFGGRIVGLIWMFAALIAVSSFTAAIASALTVGQLSGRVNGPDDLPHVKVASVAGTTSADWLQQHHINFRAADSAQQAVADLKAGKVDAVVYDAPLLSYLIGQDDSNSMSLLPQTVARQDYVLVLPRGSDLRKPLNESILQLLGNPQWQAQWASINGGNSG